jgi:hypothetical protein
MSFHSDAYCRYKDDKGMEIVVLRNDVKSDKKIICKIDRNLQSIDMNITEPCSYDNICVMILDNVGNMIFPSV